MVPLSSVCIYEILCDITEVLYCYKTIRLSDITEVLYYKIL
jgi:hypothetical protein